MLTDIDVGLLTGTAGIEPATKLPSEPRTFNRAEESTLYSQMESVGFEPTDRT
ncbi:TPA: hypothetical protein U1W74_001121 [Streptococcus suis]|nr:hypothetical protein [Streptococcus suis]